MMGRKRRNRIKGGFVPIPNHLIDSPIWRYLTASDMKVYVQAQRLQWKHTEFSLSDSRFKHMMSHETLVNSRRRLVGFGMLELVEFGGLCAYRNASTYRISEKWREMDSTRVRELVGQMKCRNSRKRSLPGISNTESGNQTAGQGDETGMPEPGKVVGSQQVSATGAVSDNQTPLEAAGVAVVGNSYRRGSGK